MCALGLGIFVVGFVVVSAADHYTLRILVFLTASSTLARSNLNDVVFSWVRFYCRSFQMQ